MIKIKTSSKKSINSSDYHIFLLEKAARFTVDFIDYQSSEYAVLFTSPYQNIEWLDRVGRITQVCFHSDYYCIEYHKKEVACNGILFNNIYLSPHIEVGKEVYEEVEMIIHKMERELLSDSPFSESIVKTYLQLILAICSREKSKVLANGLLNRVLDKDIIDFPNILDKNFIKEKKVEFYANYFNVSISLFSKKIKQQFGKTPSQLIQERTILEAKKLLHLTNKSIKEIAFELNFDDEFYFSRYFKKVVNISPSFYRKNVGISIVAK